MVTWLNKHSGICNGFFIRVLPKKKGNHRYQIMKNGDCFGIDFSLPEARQTIHRIVNNNFFIIN